MLEVLTILAQTGSQSAVSVLDQSFQLSRQVEESWDFIWATITNPAQQSLLWGAIVNFSLTIAVLALLYMFVRYGSEIARTKYIGTVIEMFLWPIAVVFLLGRFNSGNAFILSQIIGLLRGVWEDQIREIVVLQMAGITLGDAVKQVQLNQLGTQRIYQVVSECKGLSGEALQNCLDAKQPEMISIVDSISLLDGNVNTSPLEAIAQSVINITNLGALDAGIDFFQGGFSQVFQDRLYPLVQSFLYILQWAFLNLVEVALFFTALLAPIAVALSLLPVAGKPIWACLTGFLSLYALKLGYTLVVGVIAVVIVNTQGDIAEVSLGYGFILFSAVFAPILATLIAGGGGVALYQGIARRAAAMTGAVSGGITTLVTGGFLR